MSWLLPQAARLLCAGVQIRGAPQARLQAVLAATPSQGGENALLPQPLPKGSQPGRRLSKWSGLKRCKGERESKQSKSREQALTADGFCPLLSASCNKPELLPRAGSALPSLARLAVQMLSQPLAS